MMFSQTQVVDTPPATEPYQDTDNVMSLENVSIAYSGQTAVDKVSFNVKRNKVTSIIGPSGCGKSTLLRSLNRMNDFVPNVSVEGKITFDNTSILSKSVDPVGLRRRVCRFRRLGESAHPCRVASCRIGDRHRSRRSYCDRVGGSSLLPISG